MGVDYLIPGVIWGHLITVSHNLRVEPYCLLPLGNNVVMRFEADQSHTPPLNHPLVTTLKIKKKYSSFEEKNSFRSPAKAKKIK